MEALLLATGAKMTTVTLSDQARAVAALEEEKARLFSEAARIAAEQRELLKRLVEGGKEHERLLARLVAVEKAQALLLSHL